MRPNRFVGFAAALAVACSSTAPDVPGPWGSDQVALAFTNGVTTLQILASGCYGSYGELDQPVPSGTFVIAGRYTQLMGVSPGRVVYPATFSGVTADRQMTMTVAVPALQRSFGPYVLRRGVVHNWESCKYP